MLRPTDRIAIFMEGAIGDPSGKMGNGILRYSLNDLVCVIDRHHAGQNAREVLRLPGDPVPIVDSIESARALGANVFLLGIAPLGGKIPADWYTKIDRAVELDMSVVNGLHDRLAPRYSNLPAGQWVWDIRIEPEGLANATGETRFLTNRRLLMIGTDMSVGKMTAGLEIFRAAREAGVRAEFVATGQIGITIMGSGVPLDAVRVDYAGGSIEREVMRCRDAELIIVEGQGSLAHPGSTATLPLLRGSMPTHMLLCLRARQTHLLRAPSVAIPPLREFITLYEDLAEAAGTFPRPQTVGLCVITAGLTPGEARNECEKLSAETGLPAFDPVRDGGRPYLELLR